MIEPIRLRDGVFGYSDHGDWRPLVARDDVLFGWKPAGFLRVDADALRVVFWEGPDDAIGMWYLTPDGEILAHAMSALATKHQDHLEILVRQWSVARASLTRLGTPRDGSSDIPPRWIEVLLSEWLSSARHGVKISGQEEAGGLPHLSRTLDPANAEITVSNGELAVFVPHPITGDRVRMSHSLCLDDFRTVWPLPGSDDLYLCRAGHKASFVALYDATEKRLFVGQGDASWLAPYAFGSIEIELIRHLDEYWDVLPAYLGLSRTHLAPVFRHPPHIGHQLYNELGGLDQLLANNPDLLRNPMAMILSAEGAEVYGPVERLFPEMEGSVLRCGSDWRRVAYRQGLCATRLTVEYVSAALRARLNVVAAISQTVTSDRERARALRSEGVPIIVLGLRVENRTLTDLPGFLRSLVTAIKADWPDAVVVIDGHNRRHSDTSEVFSSGLLCRRDPHEVEREIVADLAAHCAIIGLEMIDLVGAVMERSIFWSGQATAFVAPWGAGLAKYRWIANCPGVVLSNTWNAAYRADFQIYSDVAYMERPSSVLFVASDKVADDPDTDNLVMMNPPDQPVEGALNFTVPVDEVMILLRRLVPRSKGLRLAL